MLHLTGPKFGPRRHGALALGRRRKGISGAAVSWVMGAGKEETGSHFADRKAEAQRGGGTGSRSQGQASTVSERHRLPHHGSQNCKGLGVLLPYSSGDPRELGCTLEMTGLQYFVEIIFAKCLVKRLFIAEPKIPVRAWVGRHRFRVHVTPAPHSNAKGERSVPYIGQPHLANAGCLIKFEFQTNNALLF